MFHRIFLKKLETSNQISNRPLQILDNSTTTPSVAFSWNFLRNNTKQGRAPSSWLRVFSRRENVRGIILRPANRNRQQQIAMWPDCYIFWYEFLATFFSFEIIWNLGGNFIIFLLPICDVMFMNNKSTVRHYISKKGPCIKDVTIF